MKKHQDLSVAKQSEIPLTLLGPDSIDLARHETNLLIIGFFGAHDNRHGDPVTRREIVLEVPGDGRRVSRTVVLEVNSRLGLPSTADRDKFLAFTKIAMEIRSRDGILTNPIRFTGYRMAQELSLVVGGNLYTDIHEWGQRMANTTISSQGIIYRKGSKAYLDTTEHVFRKFQRAGVERGSRVSEVFEVVVEDWLLENLNEMYVVREDWNAYKGLTRPTGKGLFGYLHVWFRASKGQPVERSYSNICNRLNIPEYKYPAKIRETIGKALDELVSINYLSSWSLAKMVSDSGYKFVLAPGNELLRILKITEKNLQSGTDKPLGLIEENPVITELIAIGIAKPKAIQLSKLSSEEENLDKIDYIKSLILRKGREIENPAGFAIKLLENGTAVPDTFITARKREAIAAEQRKTREQNAQTLLAELAYQQWSSEKVAARIASMYPDESLEAALKAKLPELLASYPSIKRMRIDGRMHQARLALEREIKSELDLPSFEQWSEMAEYKNIHASLFD